MVPPLEIAPLYIIIKNLIDVLLLQRRGILMEELVIFGLRVFQDRNFKEVVENTIFFLLLPLELISLQVGCVKIESLVL